MRYVRGCLVVLVTVQFYVGVLRASEDDNRLSNIVDAAGMFNERGYSKANSFSLSGNEVINDFNGNLMYTQRLLYLPISENGLHCDIKLTYNGNVSHTAFGARAGLNGIMQTPINLPEWIISVNGIGVQTFNFENELVSWRSGTQGDTISYDDDVAAHIEGYHKCYRETADGFHGIISILMEDGSVREFYSVSVGIDGPAYMIGGEYNSCSKDDPDRGYLWPIANPKYGEFTLFRSDGTQVDFEVYQPKYRSDVDCSGAFPSSTNDYPRILVPKRFRDHMGHTISLMYLYETDEDSVWGRPILAAVGDVGFGWSTWEPGITSSSNELAVSLHGNTMYWIDFAGIPPDPGVISSKAVSWKFDACRGMVYSIDTQQQEPTTFTYRTYSRTYRNLKMGGQLPFDICGHASVKYAGETYRLTPWRIWRIQNPEGGRQYVQYYMDEATAWGQSGNLGAVDNIAIDYDHSENCLSNQVQRYPCRKSEAFDLIGRDPFFLNIVAATRRTLDGFEVASTDSLMFSWLDETGDEVIDSDDRFFTTRWFGRETVTDRENGDEVKERILTYRYFPEKGTFSSRSRDRGWVMKMESSVERDFNYPTNQVKKDYYWDTDCNGLVCYGTLLLDSLRTTHDSESHSERYAYYWLGDPSLDAVNILTQKDVVDPWGIKTVTLFNTSHCSLGDPAAAYFNTGLVSDVSVRRTSDNDLLKHQTYQYHTGPYTGGFVGQLQSSTSYLLDESGTPTQTIVDRFQYNTDATLGRHRGSTQWHIDPRGDTTFYYYTSDNEVGIIYQEQDYEGTVRTRSSTFDFSDSGPFWFKKINRCGLQTFTTYREVDERGRLLWLVEPNGFRSELTYDDLNRVHMVILPGGYKPSSRDAQLPPGPQDTAWSIWNLYDDEYNDVNPDPVSIKQLTRVDHGKPSITGRVWIDGLSRAYRHDRLNADGSCDSIVVRFDFAGRSITETDQLGFVTTTEYDYLDRAVKTKYPDLAHSSDSVKYTVTNANAVGLTSRFNFPETIIYKQESRDENGHTVNEYYDVRNKLRLRQTFDGQTPLSTYFDYDDLGNLTLIIKPMGDEVRYTYNSLGKLTSERESDFESWSAAILNEYDKNGNLVSRQDPNLFYCDMPPCPIVKWHRLVYDNLDRLIQTAIETSADKAPIHFYDITGRYFYDQSNCELSKGRLSLEITYDSLGRCDYANRYDYDPRGRVKKQVNYFSALLDSTLIAGLGWEFHVHGDSIVIQYTYDWADQLKSITYPDGSVVKYDYDERGRLISVGGAQPSEVDRYARLGYTKRDQLETLVLGSGLQQLDYAYNERGWLLSINDGISSLNAPADMFGQSLYYDTHGGTAYIGSPQYNGNLFGQKISIRRFDEFFSYRYDESDRLRESFLKLQSASPAQFDEISYDANGNITRQSFADGLSKNYHYHSNTNRLTRVDNEQLKPDDTLSYDAMGNLTTHSGKRASMMYDQANRLVMVAVKTSIGADTIRYAYDNDGNRVFKAYTYQWRQLCDQQTKAGGGGELEEEDTRYPPYDTASLYCVFSDTKYTYYVLDQGGRVLAEQSTPSPSSATARFIYAGSQRIAMRDATNKLHYFLNDHLGSTRLVIDSTGVQRDVHKYYSFGKTYAEITNTNQSYRFTGKPLDKEAGLNLYYYGARYYDPELGRFLALDPAASNYPGLSPYAYCANNPVKNVDPDGERWYDIVAGSAAAFIDNAFGGNTEIRNWYEPTDASDYNLGQNIGDGLSIVGGLGEVGGGIAALGAETAVTVGSGGVAAVVTVPAAGGSVALVVHGAATAGNGVGNLFTQKGRVSGGSYSDLPEPANAGPGKDFTPAQKQRILDENARRNGGTVRSDQSGMQLDPATKAQKGVKSNMNQAEVDHIQAKSKGGSNSNSNAQVLSKKENLEKGVN